MRQFPRPGRLIQRIGNVLPDASGEIQVRSARAAGGREIGIAPLGVWTVSVELEPHDDREAAPQSRPA